MVSAITFRLETHKMQIYKKNVQTLKLTFIH